MTRGTNALQLLEPEQINVGGCSCTIQKVFEDERGVLVVDVQEPSNQDALQVYHSITYPGQARDADQWHLHFIQKDRFFVLKGDVLFALSDGSEVQLVEISADDPYMLVIPPYVYHCLKNRGSSYAMILNVPDQLYDVYDEHRIPFAKLEVPNPW